MAVAYPKTLNLIVQEHLASNMILDVIIKK